MTPDDYQRLALTKQADQDAIRDRVYGLGPKATQLDNAARGIAEEAGECQAVVKRWLEYGRPLDRERGLDEAGDVLWRVAQYLDALGYTVGDAMEANLSKLGVRYAAGFTAAEAADENRDRAAEAKAVVLVCGTCNGSGYAVHPENGTRHGVRCPRGCRVACSICSDPDCDNPGGQH